MTTTAAQRRWFEALRALHYFRRGMVRLFHPSVRPHGLGRAAFYQKVWRDAAEDLGAEFVSLANGFCEIRRGDAVVRVYENIVGIDDPLVTKVVRVKPFVSRELGAHGIPVPPFQEFTLDTLDRAEQFLADAHGPCVVKPISGESAGTGVTTNVRTRRDLRRAAVVASLSDRELMIERQIEGVSYRLLFLDGELLDATCRRPPCVFGDGRSTIKRLIYAENERRAAQRGGATLTRIQIDSDCITTLKRAGLSLRSVPPEGSAVQVKTAVNDNSALDNIWARNLIGEPLEQELARATAVLGIRFAGIDIITNNPAVSLKEGGGAVIEVNASPGLHHHYNVAVPGPTTRVAVPVLRRLLEEAERKDTLHFMERRTA
jgi:D-alanine-D-alanine ligase-like ATP-grasp enzyme